MDLPFLNGGNLHIIAEQGSEVGIRISGDGKLASFKRGCRKGEDIGDIIDHSVSVVLRDNAHFAISRQDAACRLPYSRADEVFRPKP